MSKKEDERPDVKPGSTNHRETMTVRIRFDPAAHVPLEVPPGFDRRRFIMRSAVISAAAVLTGCTRSETESKRARADARGGHSASPRRHRWTPT